MDKRDEEIMIATAEAWCSGKPAMIRHVAREIGHTPSYVHARITGRWGGGAKVAGYGLIAQGWLTPHSSGEALVGVLAPGPRFGGLLRNKRTGEVKLLAKIG